MPYIFFFLLNLIPGFALNSDQEINLRSDLSSSNQIIDEGILTLIPMKALHIMKANAEYWEKAITIQKPYGKTLDPIPELKATLLSGASLRGISAINNSECWVSGSKGTIAMTLDGGNHWESIRIPGTDSLDFRDIEVLNNGRVIVLSAGSNTKSKIFTSVDRGNTWINTFSNPYEEGFFNAIDFKNLKEGILVGDPLDGQLFIARTTDGGTTWKEIDNLPAVSPGEYGFAASGTNVKYYGDSIWIVTGGKQAAIYFSGDNGNTWTQNISSIQQGLPSQGIFSVDWSINGGVIVGGDYQEEQTPGNRNIEFWDNEQKKWTLAGREIMIPFISAVKWIDTNIIATGPGSTVFYTKSKNSWKVLEMEGYHTLDIGVDRTIWFAGSKGRIAKTSLKSLLK